MELQRFEGYKDIVWAVAFTPDGKQIIAAGGGDYIHGNWVLGSDYALRLWDVQTGKELKRFAHRHSDAVTPMNVTP